MKFAKYEKKLTSQGDREAVHAVFEIGAGSGPLSINYTKDGLEHRINTMKDENGDRLVMLDVLFNWPDEHE